MLVYSGAVSFKQSALVEYMSGLQEKQKLFLDQRPQKWKITIIAIKKRSEWIRTLAEMSEIFSTIYTPAVKPDSCSLMIWACCKIFGLWHFIPQEILGFKFDMQEAEWHISFMDCLFH